MILETLDSRIGEPEMAKEQSGKPQDSPGHGPPDVPGKPERPPGPPDHVPGPPDHVPGPPNPPKPPKPREVG